MKKIYFMLLLMLWLPDNSFCQDSINFTQEEIIYGHKNGLATTMIRVQPLKTNGKAIISIISGNWISNYKRFPEFLAQSTPLLDAGYTVFFTMHSSAPLFDISIAAADIKRAVQFVRYHAAAYKIDPDNIGITGSSSGGHLSLVAATSDDIKNENATDPVEKVSSKVQAAAVFYPPTDFLNWGQKGFSPASNRAILEAFGVLGAFDFKQFDTLKFIYTSITDAAKILSIANSVSPANLVTSDDAPTYIIHGDKDKVVPLQQSQLLQEKLTEAKVPVVLTIKPGADHGWENMAEDRKEFVKWFDKYLK